METALHSDPFLSRFAAGPSPLEAIDFTDQLDQRPRRVPDYEGENQAFKKLAKLLSQDPRVAMQGLVEETMRLCGADSAGISIAEMEDGNRIFRWHAVAGTLSPFLNGTMPRDFSPCGEVCKRGAPMLLRDMHLHYKYVEALNLHLHEVLLFPFFRDGEAVGTVWVVSHGKHKHFDHEDVRLLGSLAEFTAGIVQSYYLVEEIRAEKLEREHFITALSHDLRTPLTAAKIGAHILKSKIDPAYSRQAERIVSNMNRADTMIQNLLDLDRLRAGEKVSLYLREFDLLDIIRFTIEELATIHGDRFILVGEHSLVGQMDGEAVRRVIENLMSNAIKYGDASSPITITVGKDSETVMISVHNFGPAISPEDQKKLFLQYHRTQSAIASNQRGWGIGLTIVRGIVESMQGTVTVTSGEFVGTTFTVKLPLRSFTH